MRNEIKAAIALATLVIAVGGVVYLTLENSSSGSKSAAVPSNLFSNEPLGGKNSGGNANPAGTKPPASPGAPTPRVEAPPAGDTGAADRTAPPTARHDLPPLVPGAGTSPPTAAHGSDSGAGAPPVTGASGTPRSESNLSPAGSTGRVAEPVRPNPPSGDPASDHASTPRGGTSETGARGANPDLRGPDPRSGAGDVVVPAKKPAQRDPVASNDPKKPAATPNGGKPTASPGAPAGDSAGAALTDYVVQSGDSLRAIAKDRYGNADHWRKIAAANPGVDANKLRVGQTLKLPSRESVRGATARSTGKPEAAKTETARSEPSKTAAPGTETAKKTAPKTETPKTVTRGTGTTPPASADRTKPLTASTKVPAGEKPEKPRDNADRSADGARRQASPAAYAVAQGDTLRRIARVALQDESRWREIYLLNRDKLRSPDALESGMQLRLPAADKSKARQHG